MVRFQRLSALPIARRPTGSFRITGLALCVGLVTGLLVVGIKQFVAWLQIASLGFAADNQAAPNGHVSLVRVLVALCIGALCVSAISAFFDRLRRGAVHAEGADRCGRGQRIAWRADELA